MLKIIKKNKGQNTAEYAILIALVIGAIIAMQTYAQRGLQARMRGTSLYMKDQMGTALLTARGANAVGTLNATGQYEPYYQNSVYQSDKDSQETVTASPDLIGTRVDSTKTRRAVPGVSGFDETTYNATIGASGQD